MPKKTASLFINSLEISISLGWTKAERQKKQSVLFDAEIIFLQLPKACINDNLDNTVCYAELIELIHVHVSKKAYKLIEHLANDLYQLIKSKLPNTAKLLISITKHPKIKNLHGGVSFHFGDK